MKLIIQIPCFNEEETLKQTLDDLPSSIEGIDEIEYLVINDGSKDKTTAIAKEWGVNYIVNFTQNKGLAKGFMGKEWDGSGIEYNIEMWSKCLRVLKPRGLFISFWWLSYIS